MPYSFYEDYFSYVGETEAPMLYHRWSAISMIGALLGRSVHFPFGHGAIYPNQYIMLVGSPGARKGTAMKPTMNSLRDIKYNKLASNRISPECFLKEIRDLNNGIEELTDSDFAELSFDQPSEIYVISEEFGDFIKSGNIDFINLLTNLWDNLPEYKHPKLHGESIVVNAPTNNMFGAITPHSMSISLPMEAIGQGFMSRWILVHGDPTGRKITFPIPPTKEKASRITERITKIRELVKGQITMTNEASRLLDKIYHSYVPLEDSRFEHYNTRRFTHLIKLATIFAAMDNSIIVNKVHALAANTLLHVTEQRMPRAMGEFGKAKHADVANAIIDMLKKARKPMTITEIWKNVIQDLGKMEELVIIIRNLQTAEKIKQVDLAGKRGFLAMFKTNNGWDKELLVEDFLTSEEKL